jgi:hypothetical protein
VSRRLSALALAGGLALLGGCQAAPEAPLLAVAKLAPDFETYTLRRIGLMPIPPSGLESVEQRRLLDDFTASVRAEFAAATPYEWIALSEFDTAEVPASDPMRTGNYQAATLITLARRYSLDGLLFVSLIDQHPYPPQRLSAAVELVAADTGQVIWNSAVQLDATDGRVQRGLEAYYGSLGDATTDWHVALLSPRRFADFAAWQLAQLL